MRDLITRAEHELRHEPLERRVRATLGSETAVDSTRPFSSGSRAGSCHLRRAGRGHPGAAVACRNAGGRRGGPAAPGDPVRRPHGFWRACSVGDRTAAGFRLADDDLAGYVELDFDAFDGWYEEDEPIAGHPRSPFHSIHVHRSSRPVRVELDGDVLAETTRARLLSETSLPLRFYLPLEDVRAELHPSSTRTYCRHKGEASYWSLEAGGRRRVDLGWTYEEPLHEAAAITGLVAFWDELVDVYLDGERREGPHRPLRRRAPRRVRRLVRGVLPPRPVRGRDRDTTEFPEVDGHRIRARRSRARRCRRRRPGACQGTLRCRCPSAGR